MFDFANRRDNVINQTSFDNEKKSFIIRDNQFLTYSNIDNSNRNVQNIFQKQNRLKFYNVNVVCDNITSIHFHTHQ